MHEIKFLAEVPDYAEQLAHWHYREWAHLFTDWTLPIAIEELKAHAKNVIFPTTLVAENDQQLVGSVSLISEDAKAFDDIGSPWLASLYVLPEFRGKGLGKLLVQALMQHAKSIPLSAMYLFTPEHRGFYERLGWQCLSKATLHGQAVDIMKIDLLGEENS